MCFYFKYNLRFRGLPSNPLLPQGRTEGAVVLLDMLLLHSSYFLLLHGGASELCSCSGLLQGVGHHQDLDSGAPCSRMMPSLGSLLVVFLALACVLACPFLSTPPAQFMAGLGFWEIVLLPLQRRVVNKKPADKISCLV